MFLTSLLSFLMITLTNSRGTVYQCLDESYADEQCLFQEKLGDINFKWVRKCKGAKVCVQLPYYNNLIGACNIKVRTHYDNEPCANGNKCTSGICDGTKCKGYDIGHSCVMGLGQCQRGTVCRYNTIDDDISTCQVPISGGQACVIPSSNEMTIKDDETSIYGSKYSFFVPWYNPCDLDLICYSESIENLDNYNKTMGTCESLSKKNNGDVVNNPMLCSSGFFNITDRKCMDLTDDSSFCDPINGGITCQLTSKGAYYTLNKTMTNTFGDWITQLQGNEKDSSKTNIEAYRYTRNNKKINKLFFNYTHYGWISDADECAFDYMWKNSNGNWIKVTLTLLFLGLIF